MASHSSFYALVDPLNQCVMLTRLPQCRLKIWIFNLVVWALLTKISFYWNNAADDSMVPHPKQDDRATCELVLSFFRNVFLKKLAICTTTFTNTVGRCVWDQLVHLVTDRVVLVAAHVCIGLFEWQKENNFSLCYDKKHLWNTTKFSKLRLSNRPLYDLLNILKQMIFYPPLYDWSHIRLHALGFSNTLH